MYTTLRPEAPTAVDGMSRRRFLIGAAGFTVGSLFADRSVLPVSADPVTTARATEPADTLAHELQAAPVLPSSHFIRTGPSNRQRVAITVDDFSSFPHIDALDYLEGLLALGKEYRTHFTLFPIGQELDRQYDPRNHPKRARRARSLWRAAITDGHVIGNHTWSHDEQIATRHRARIRRELYDQHQSLTRLLGQPYTEHLFRPPGGSGGFPNDDPTSTNEIQYKHLMSVVKDLGYWSTMWSTDSNDAHGNMVIPGDTVAEEDQRFLHKIFHGVNGNTYEKVHNGSIILVHPNTLSLNGMEKLITGLHDRGYRCVTVPRLFAK